MKLIALGVLVLLLMACRGLSSPPASNPEPTNTAFAAPTVPAEPSPTTPPDPTATAAETAVEPTKEATASPAGDEADTVTAVSTGFTYLKDPVVTNKPTEGIFNKYINPGAVIFHDGGFHMFFNSFSDWPGVVQVGYLTSEDGLTWTPAQDDPIFISTDVAFAHPGADISSVIVEEDVTWVAYFHTVNRGASEASVIGRATAESPLGPWIVDEEPVLLPGGDGEWDGRGLVWPSVVKRAHFIITRRLDRWR
jgi:hypothetical protein